MLHLPFRNETKLVQPYLSAKQAFTEKNHLFDINDIQFEVFLHDIERRVRLLRATREEIGTLVAPNTHENELLMMRFQMVMSSLMQTI